MKDLVQKNYAIAKEMYAKLGVDTDKVLEKVMYQLKLLRLKLK